MGRSLSYRLRIKRKSLRLMRKRDSIWQRLGQRSAYIFLNEESW